MRIDTASDQIPFIIRPARAEDKEAILSFCERTYEWGDYVPEVLDEWLADEHGQLLVATVDDVPVGVAHVVLLTPTEAWLQGLRVHPQHRRKGLAGQFLLRCLDLARQRGAYVARLATSSQNVAVQKTTERAGMRHVATVWVLEAPASACPEVGVTWTPLTMDHWPVVASHILTGSALADMSGLYGMWDWQTLTESRLRHHLERGQVFALWENGQIVATAIMSDVDEKHRCLSVAHIEAADGYGPGLAHALRNHAAGLALEAVEAVVPSASPLHDAFLQAGFERGEESAHEICIYELKMERTSHLEPS
jgi:GNAT superfamily N-acetyltransferase/predicted GNAT family acetyltransferase